MNEQPNPAISALPPRRGPASWLRSLPIWSKLGLILIVPTIATAVVGANGVIGHLDTAANADRARGLASLVEASGALVDDLQDERTDAVLLLGSDKAKTKKYRDAYTAVRPKADEAKRSYAGRRAELDTLPANFDDLLARIDRGLADLPRLRNQVLNANLRLTDAIRAYDTLINDLLDMRESAVPLANDFSLSERMRAAAALARSKEFLSQRRIVVHRALIENKLPRSLQTEFIAAEQGQQQALQTFDRVAGRADAELYQQTVSGSDIRGAEAYSEWVRTKAVDSMRYAPFSADEWDQAMVQYADLVNSVEAQLDKSLVAQATALRDNVRRQLLIETGALLGMLLLAVLFAWLLARSMARSLRLLRHGALTIAEHGLPQAVRRLRDQQLIADMTPDQVADQIAEPLPVRTRDELGQVTAAFNAVHLAAVRTAAEQAALRSSVSTMIVNLARRSQILVDRLIGHLDRLERGEEDPDRLAELFKLDHLATRMRRNDENLLVLAGADSARVQREPAALTDVLRAAQSEVEHYTRVEFGVVDRDIDIAAHAVNDLVHLVAELLDNATAFSPPDTPVTVEARRIGDRAVLYVEDSGIGISQEQLRELNRRLATPPDVDVTVSRMMGLVVVSRLAARHGLQVELRPGGKTGTVADVVLSASVLVPRALPGAAQQPGQELDQPQIPAQRPALPTPFAIEGARPGPGSVSVQGEPGGPQFGPPSGGDARSGPAGRPTLAARMSAATRSGSFPTVRPDPSGRFDSTEIFSATQGRSAGPRTDSGGVTNAQGMPGVPRQARGSGWTGTGQPGVPPVSGPPPFVPPVSGPPSFVPPVSGPPAFVPPVSVPPRAPFSVPPAPAGPHQAPPQAPALSQPPSNAPAPPVWPPAPAPERLGLAPDMTAELPRATEPSASSAASPEARSGGRYADETQEMPIFRELESAWFRTQRPGSAESGAGAAGTGSTPSPTNDGAGGEAAGFASQNERGRPMASVQEGVVTSGVTPSDRTGEGVTSMTGSETAAEVSMHPSPESGDAASQAAGDGGWDSGTPRGWRTAADEGWRAASEASQVTSAQTTPAGLPKRVPMARLVPGGVDRPVNATQRRTPEAVRGLLSAYHRGVQRGRSHPRDDNQPGPEAASGEQQSGQAGGPGTGGGQKEHEG